MAVNFPGKLDFLFYLEGHEWLSVEVRILYRNRPSDDKLICIFSSKCNDTAFDQLTQWIVENAPVGMVRNRIFGNIREYNTRSKKWHWHDSFDSFTITWRMSDGAELIDFHVGSFIKFFDFHAKNLDYTLGHRLKLLTASNPDWRSLVMYYDDWWSL